MILLKFWKFDDKINKLVEGDCAGAGSCLVIFGKNNLDIVSKCNFKGEFIYTKNMINKK
jgi:hypothetical protein